MGGEIHLRYAAMASPDYRLLKHLNRVIIGYPAVFPQKAYAHVVVGTMEHDGLRGHTSRSGKHKGETEAQMPPPSRGKQSDDINRCQRETHYCVSSIEKCLSSGLTSDSRWKRMAHVSRTISALKANGWAHHEP